MQSKISKPIIIIGPPRSGTTLLFTLLNSHPGVFSLYEESRFIFHSFYKRKLAEGIEFADDSLQPEDCSAKDIKVFRADFHRYSFQDRNLGLLFNKFIRKKPYLKLLAAIILRLNSFSKNIWHHNYRLVEKTPRNCFKIALLNEIFPDAKFIFLKREPRANISSLMEGWKKRATKYNGESKRLPKVSQRLNLSNFSAESWRFVLPSGWQDYTNKSLEELCAYQWSKSVESALEDLEAIPAERKIFVSYEELVNHTPETLKRICEFSELSFSQKLQKLASKPPEVNYLDSRPDANKWKKNEEAISRIIPQIAETALKLGYDLNKTL